jgi:hypothetical protein
MRYSAWANKENRHLSEYTTKGSVYGTANKKGSRLQGNCKMKGFNGRTSEKLFGPAENLTKLKFVKKQKTKNEFGEGTRTSKVFLRYGQVEYNKA